MSVTCSLQATIWGLSEESLIGTWCVLYALGTLANHILFLYFLFHIFTVISIKYPSDY